MKIINFNTYKGYKIRNLPIEVNDLVVSKYVVVQGNISHPAMHHCF